jgi:large subunit ribosomal protein L31
MEANDLLFRSRRLTFVPEITFAKPIKENRLCICRILIPAYLCNPVRVTVITQPMKKDIHPENYRMVVFKDMSNETTFITRSTTDTKETITWEDGNEYPLVKLEISNTSHPFYTGKMKLVDTAGRIDKFRSRYEKKK